MGWGRLPFAGAPIEPEEQRGGGGQTANHPKGQGMVVGERHDDVHGEDTDDEGGEHQGDGDDGEGFDEPVEVIGDDGGAGVHEAGEDVGIDFSLAVALTVFDENIVEGFEVFGGEADLGGVGLEFFGEDLVGVNGVEVIDEAFLEGKHVDEIFVLEGGVDLLFDLAGDHGDGAKVLVEMENDAVEHLEQDILEGLDAGELTALENGDVFGEDDDDAVFEDEHAGGGDAEKEVIFAAVVFGAFEDEGGVLRLELEAGQLIGVEGGVEGVFVELELFEEIAFFGVIGRDEDKDLAIRSVGFHEFVFGYSVMSQHIRVSGSGAQRLRHGAKSPLVVMPGWCSIAGGASIFQRIIAGTAMNILGFSYRWHNHTQGKEACLWAFRVSRAAASFASRCARIISARPFS